MRINHSPSTILTANIITQERMAFGKDVQVRGGSYSTRVQLTIFFHPTISTLKIPAIQDTACIPGFHSDGRGQQASGCGERGLGQQLGITIAKPFFPRLG